MVVAVRPEQVESLFRGDYVHPFSLLGDHRIRENGVTKVTIRALLPDAGKAEVVLPESTHEMSSLHPGGLFEVQVNDFGDGPYRLRWVDAGGEKRETFDPYQFRLLLTEFDFHLLGEGNHFNAYEKLGAHIEVKKGVSGTRFAVWAPNARGVAIVGDFNRWNRLSHPMHVRDGTGIWELFIPELGEGELYKYLVRFRDGGSEQKIDPYGFYFETPPRTAAVVFDLGKYRWNDDEWMKTRSRRNAFDAPICVYEVHLGSWKRIAGEDESMLSYRELAEDLVPHVREMGFTHIELLPITEHPLAASWGYQTTGYFAPTSRHGDPDDFRHFVDVCHQNDIGVILDWVPAHFPRDGHALARFDGTHLYEHSDPRQGAHPDWGTLIFNYGRNEVRNFLLSNALFWLDEYHLDGLRVDAVASMIYLDYSREDGEWLPNRYGGNENLEAIDFIKRFNESAHHYHPGVLTVAEESTAWPGVSRPTHLGGLGFSFKWNMGWMHDSLDYVSKESIFRKYHHNNLTFSLVYAFSENFILPLSHDEVVHGKGSLIGKMPGDLWQKFANFRNYLSYMYAHPGKKLLFMGMELAQWSEWNFDSSLDWHLLEYSDHEGVLRVVRDLNRLYRHESALHQQDSEWQGFEWIDFRDADSSVISFLRKARDPKDFLVVACNFTPVPRQAYRLGVPKQAFYREIFNSDSAYYGGSNLGNAGGIMAENTPWGSHPFSIAATLPPLATIVFKPEA